MARYVGKDGSVSIGSDDVGELTAFDLTITATQVDGSVMGSDWTGNDSGQKSASGSITVKRDPSDSAQVALVVGSKVDCTFYFEGNTTGLSSMTGTFLVTEAGHSASLGENISTSYSVVNDGPVTESTIS